MRSIVIIGSRALAARAFTRARREGCEVVAVCAPEHGRHKGEPDALRDVAEQAGVPWVNTDLEGWAVPACDVGFSLFNSAYLSKADRAACRLGILGYHPSLLPRHRGGDAVRWTIKMRDPIAGGTLFWLDDRADAGDIAYTHWCHVLPHWGPRELWLEGLEPIGDALVTKALRELGRRGCDIPRCPQIEAAATWEPLLQGHGRLRGASHE